MQKRTATDLDIEIGKRLRQARVRLDLTQADLAKAAGLSFQQIQKYEKGDNRIAVSTLARLRPVLGIEAVDLLPPLRPDGSPISDPLAAQGQTITGLSLAKLYGQMLPHQQTALVEMARAVISANAPSQAAA